MSRHIWYLWGITYQGRNEMIAVYKNRSKIMSNSIDYQGHSTDGKETLDQHTILCLNHLEIYKDTSAYSESLFKWFFYPIISPCSQRSYNITTAFILIVVFQRGAVGLVVPVCVGQEWRSTDGPVIHLGLVRLDKHRTKRYTEIQSGQDRAHNLCSCQDCWLANIFCFVRDHIAEGRTYPRQQAIYYCSSRCVQ